MLNVIWLVLIIVGTLVAVGQDVFDLSTNRYQNGREVRATLRMDSTGDGSLQPFHRYPCTVIIESGQVHGNGGKSLQGAGPVQQKAELLPSGGKKGRLHIFVDDHTPPLWKEIYKVQKNSGFLSAKVHWEEPQQVIGPVQLSFDPVRFIKVQAITNEGLIHYAKVAVELAIGLIGIMALWLGLMKIAEQAGLIAHLAKALKGVTTRLFPEVPPDHPAMGAMIMNISANMLGLGNAATPFGLKAMEELEKLNKKPGTATDAMCTFLVINTSNVQLIPATVIALRAVAGSANPTEILGPVIVATTINTIIGLIAVKFLAKLPLFKNQLKTEGA
jgi:spore maturation protein A